MKAIILAAGRGSRMRNLTINQPKCFIELHGKRLIDWQLSSLRGAGIEEIAIVTGYKRQMFSEDLRYFVNSNWQNSNILASLLTATDWLEKYSCIISYSDIVYSCDAVKRLKILKDPIGIAYDKNWFSLWSKRFTNPLSDAESFKTNSQGLLTDIGRKPKNLKEIEGQFMGLLKIEPIGWQEILSIINEFSFEEKMGMDITTLLRKLLNSGIDISAIPIGDSWYEVDSESDLSYYSSLKSLW